MSNDLSTTNRPEMDKFNSGAPIEPPTAGPSRTVTIAPPSRLRKILSYLKAELSRPSLLSTSSSSNGRGSDGISVTGSAIIRPTNYRTNTAASSQCLSPNEDRDEEEKEEGETIYAVIVDGDLRGAAASVVPDSSDAGQSTEAMRHGGSLNGSAKPSQTTAARLQAQGTRMPGYEWIVAIWRATYYFFDSSFEEGSKEKSFQKEQYYGRRNLSTAAATFYLIMWGVFCGLTPQPFSLYDKIAYIGGYGVVIIPIPIMVLFNTPYRYPWVWQISLFIATWAQPDLGLIEMLVCNFFGVVYGTSTASYCANRTMFSTFIGSIGQQTLAIMALGQNRFMATLGFLQFFILMGALFFGRGTPDALYRDAVYFIVYSVFLVVTNFITERSSRQLFEMRDQLKLQYKATQKAQVLEKKASDLTKRFVSYIFHEVRVPLNSALLSVQNLVGEGTFKDFTEDQNEMVEGLTGSLGMMEKVLNDVLSFNRMETGRFTQARAPFDLNKAIHLTILSHSISAQSKGLTLDEILDPGIDKLDCQFIGDEMRLRQITSNLVSNAVKFTQSGGVKVVTRLMFSRTDNDRSARQSMEASMLPQEPKDPEKGSIKAEDFRIAASKRKTAQAVVRVEVHDTGTGFRKQDLVDDRLFSPYVQTEIGRRQGGKGTGLGLALVRQIVQLAHGRLGVDSTYGQGMSIWFELPFNLQPNYASAAPADPEDSDFSGSGSETKYAQSHTNKGSFEVYSDQQEGRDEHIKTTEETAPTTNHQDFAVLTKPSHETSQPQRPQLSKSSSSQTSLQKEAKDKVLPLPGDSDPRPSIAEEVSADPLRRESIASVISNKTSSTLDKRKGSVASESSVATGALGEDALNALVVDDDKLTRTLMARMVKRLGHKTTMAENGQDALEKILRSYEGQEDSPVFDVIFLDNQMPLMTGVEVASELRSKGHNVYIVGCTGNALISDQEEYLSAGADRILTKPIKQAAIEECIKAARERSQELRDGQAGPPNENGQ